MSRPLNDRPAGFDAPLLRPERAGAARWMSTFAVVAVALMCVTAVAWSSLVEIDQVTRASGQLIASSRVQIVQSVDGGVIERLHVREGDTVEAGQTLATLDSGRTQAALRESEARSAALRAALARLAVEAQMGERLAFPAALGTFPSVQRAQQALFEQRRRSLLVELDALESSASIARQELALVQNLHRAGDVSQVELLRVSRLASEAEAQLVIRKNRWLQDVRAEQARAEDELAQLEQVQAQRREVLDSLVIRAPVRGIVKNVRVTTRGGVLRPGEELLQIVPADDRLIVEARVRPSDIALLRPGLPVSIKFDAYDYTAYGAVAGKLSYISADTIRDDSRAGEQLYYRVHVETDIPPGAPAETGLRKRLDVMPGMTVTVDIRTGRRSALSYMLKPIRRTLDEAFSEP
ncbi:MAG: HlyD family efflux transporter periplasmic adaptor subunit [Betaproteobacteria bacterium]|nr:HlyD family efflux transporter periplasmic adaptor subunit [Betaproteobacteria bacterium]